MISRNYFELSVEAQLAEDVGKLRQLNKKLEEECVLEVTDNTKLKGEFKWDTFVNNCKRFWGIVPTRTALDMVEGYMVDPEKPWCAPFARSEPNFSVKVKLLFDQERNYSQENNCSTCSMNNENCSSDLHYAKILWCQDYLTKILSSCGTSRKPKLVKPETSFSGKDFEKKSALWWRQIRQNLPWKSSLGLNFLIFHSIRRGLSKQATAERRRQFGFGSR